MLAASVLACRTACCADGLVVAPGSVVRTLPIPGLAERGIGFKTVGEAIYLRNHVLSRLDYAASVTDEARRRKALTFVFIGGGYAGVEAFAELEDMARYATRYYPDIRPADLRWVLVEAAGRILPEVSVPMSEYTVRQLLKRDLDVRLETRVVSRTSILRLSNCFTVYSDIGTLTSGRIRPVASISTQRMSSGLIEE